MSVPDGLVAEPEPDGAAEPESIVEPEPDGDVDIEESSSILCCEFDLLVDGVVVEDGVVESMFDESMLEPEPMLVEPEPVLEPEPIEDEPDGVEELLEV